MEFWALPCWCGVCTEDRLLCGGDDGNWFGEIDIEQLDGMEFLGGVDPGSVLGAVPGRPPPCAPGGGPDPHVARDVAMKLLPYHRSCWLSW